MVFGSNCKDTTKYRTCMCQIIVFVFEISSVWVNDIWLRLESTHLKSIAPLLETILSWGIAKLGENYIEREKE